MRRTLLSLAAACMAFAPVAVNAADMKPMMTTKGKVLLSEDFSGSSVDPKWQAAKGKWDIKDGMLHGTELASDNHPAVIRTNLKLGDAIYQFDFKFAESGKVIHLSLNNSAGHVCRVQISPNGYFVKKDGSKTDTADKPVTIDSCKMKFEPGKTYTMMVETLGDEIFARVDDQHYAFGADKKVGAEKSNFGFPIGGEGCIDNVMVWEAKSNPEWGKTKDELAAKHPEKLAEERPAAAKGAPKAGAKKKKAE